MDKLGQQHKADLREAAKLGTSQPLPFQPGFESWRASLEGKESALEACVTIGCKASTLDVVANFLQHDGVYGAFGIHPLNADDWNDNVEEKLLDLANHPKVVAWGECGLDYFHKDTRGILKDSDVISRQRNVFSRQMELAASLGLPLVVHTREAEKDTLELMKRHLPQKHPVHVHCFTSAKWLAEELLAAFPNLRIGFTGVVTFKNAPKVQDVVRSVPLDRIVLETDGPYMAPEPHRGRVAHPGHVAYVAERIAKLKREPLETVLSVCRETTRQLYGV